MTCKFTLSRASADAITLLPMNIYDELQWRGLVSDCTDAVELNKRLATGPLTLYAGFDPTADSLHVGSLVPLLVLRRFQLFGHHPIAVAGGATGSIGDPSGKSAERQLLTRELLNANIAGVKPQLARWLDFDAKGNPARLVDNADWTAQLSYLDFLRDVGKHFTVNMMVAKESIRARMEDREVGISYTEFSYMLLQAFDFYHLCKDCNCELQVGGSDQWGNITAGIDLTRKKLGRHVFGLTQPLITKADGSKFGKTEAGTVWLDAKRTSVYKFYQFWINSDDRDVMQYLRYFSFKSREELEELEKATQEKPQARLAQRALAKEITTLVHGEEEARQAEEASQALFGRGSLATLAEATLRAALSETGLHPLAVAIPTVLAVLKASGLVASTKEALRTIAEGGAYLNNERVTDSEAVLDPADLLHGRYVVVRRGKKSFAGVEVAWK